MRLKKLQVSGFKSFVDTTDIRLPSQLSGIVGPNGCGKSNVIDAVRWVMGETSAKNLRGDSMADVIFNGSAARKPVGKASVELIFDNNQQRLEGSYAKFSEIAIKRTLTRDGQSSYFINNVKVRRKDVLDLFRGTGLGPRSYSIIEQGMVSQIIEARPEDLRGYVEEAAGVSKYKDKRRETENRIAHTRENLERVSDIRNELDKQLSRLKRQSSSAKRFKALKEEQYVVQAQLLHLRLLQLEQQLNDQNRKTAEADNALQKYLTTQRELEKRLEEMRQQQSYAQEDSQAVQQSLHAVAIKISNIENSIEHQKQAERQHQDEIKNLSEAQRELQQLLAENVAKEQSLQVSISNILPQLSTLQEDYELVVKNLQSSESVRDEWQLEMDDFNKNAQQPAQQIEVQKSRIDYLEQQTKRAVNDQESLLQQRDSIEQQIEQSTIAQFRQKVSQQRQNFKSLEERVAQQEEKLQQGNAELNTAREQLDIIKQAFHEKSSRLQSLQEIQQATLGDESVEFDQWLERNFGDQYSRLAKHIEVAEGWQRAVDVVLADLLGAVCLDNLKTADLMARPTEKFSVFTKQIPNNVPTSHAENSLLSKVKAQDIDLSSMLTNVYVAEDLQAAIAIRDQISDGGYIVTKQGELVGSNWFRFPSRHQLETGVLVREEEIDQLQNELQQTQLQLEQQQQKVDLLQRNRMETESALAKERQTIAQIRTEVTDSSTKLAREETHFLQMQSQLDKTVTQIESLVGTIERDNNDLKNAKILLQTASTETDSLQQQRQNLLHRRDELSLMVQENRSKANSSREQLHQRQLTKQQLESQINTAEETIERLNAELTSTTNRLQELHSTATNPMSKMNTLEQDLAEFLKQKVDLDTKYSASADVVNGVEGRITEISTELRQTGEKVDQSRDQLNQQKLTTQDLKTRKTALQETIVEKNYQQDEFSDDLPEEATSEQWQTKLDEIEVKINNIGPVNLVAIEEFDEQSQRMEYLDKQYTDLTEALDILEDVINKIDKDTRARFRETFEAINEHFKALFPTLFGGGAAQLIMNSDDLLTAGISVMAQPPGKRNSHIHLLSGGEKALTAVALLFSLFKLTPAPFCMMDEVDAPLDDANVGRYCETLKALSEVSQIIVVTHNKITMETMNHLVGVTMAEAGVSRLVSVDIDDAVRFSA